MIVLFPPILSRQVVRLETRDVMDLIPFILNSTTIRMHHGRTVRFYILFSDPIVTNHEQIGRMFSAFGACYHRRPYAHVILMLSSVYDMIDERILSGRHIGHGAHNAQMPRAYRRHQGLVRLIIIISFFYTRYSKSYFVFSYHRLEERGWMVFPQHEGGNGECSGDHDGSTIVLVQTRKRRMDPERYLDATQRCVFDRGIIDGFFLSDSRVFFFVL